MSDGWKLVASMALALAFTAFVCLILFMEVGRFASVERDVFHLEQVVRHLRHDLNGLRCAPPRHASHVERLQAQLCNLKAKP